MISLIRAIMEALSASPTGLTAGMLELKLGHRIPKESSEIRTILSSLKDREFLSNERGRCCECGAKAMRYKIIADDWRDKIRGPK